MRQDIWENIRKRARHFWFFYGHKVLVTRLVCYMDGIRLLGITEEWGIDYHQEWWVINFLNESLALDIFSPDDTKKMYKPIISVYYLFPLHLYVYKNALCTKKVNWCLLSTHSWGQKEAGEFFRGFTYAITSVYLHFWWQVMEINMYMELDAHLLSICNLFWIIQNAYSFSRRASPKAWSWLYLGRRWIEKKTFLSQQTRFSAIISLISHPNLGSLFTRT
jgi:hypothetical protein